MNMLDGMFSFVLLDTRDNSFIAARDAIGITPLYYGWGLDGIWLFPLYYCLWHVCSPESSGNISKFNRCCMIGCLVIVLERQKAFFLVFPLISCIN